MAAETAPRSPLDAAVEEARKALARHNALHPCSCDECTALRSLLAALDADPYITCDCGKPRLPGPCSGSCDNDE